MRTTGYGARLARSFSLIAALLSTGPLAAAEEEPQSAATEPGRGTIQLPAGVSLYRSNFALPITWSEDADGVEDVEFQFQLSFQYKFVDTPVYIAYTQVSYFRWLDDENSRPFRETNYNPEIWYRFRRGRLWPDWLGLDIGFEHESNGESQPQSRSWDRANVRAWFDHRQWRGSLKLWSRVSTADEPSTPENPGGDDNPDIIDFYGHHELRLGYTFDNGDRLSAVSRYAFSDERGALRLDYAKPTGGGSGYWFVRLFSGYGESLETFRENRTRIGFGFALLK